MTNYNDGNWHPHNGGDCPVHPKTQVYVLLKDGFMSEGVASEINWGRVVAFVVEEEHKEPIRVWVNVYEWGLDRPLSTREEADNLAVEGRIRCIQFVEVLED